MKLVKTNNTVHSICMWVVNYSKCMGNNNFRDIPFLCTGSAGYVCIILFSNLFPTTSFFTSTIFFIFAKLFIIILFLICSVCELPLTYYSKDMGIDRIVKYLFCALEVLGRSLWLFAALSLPPPPSFSLSQSSSVSLCSPSFTIVLPSSPVLSLLFNSLSHLSLSSPSSTFRCSIKLKISQL